MFFMRFVLVSNVGKKLFRVKFYFIDRKKEVGSFEM